MAKLLNNDENIAEHKEKTKNKRGIFGRSFFSKHKNETDELGSLAGDSALNYNSLEENTDRSFDNKETNLKDAAHYLDNEININKGEAANTLMHPSSDDSHAPLHLESTEFNELTPPNVNSNESQFNDGKLHGVNSLFNEPQEISNTTKPENKEVTFNQPLEFTETAHTAEEANMNEIKVDEIENILNDMEAQGITPEDAKLVPNAQDLSPQEDTQATNGLPLQEHNLNTPSIDETEHAYAQNSSLTMDANIDAAAETMLPPPHPASTLETPTKPTQNSTENNDSNSNSISLFDSTPEIKETLSPYEESIKAAQTVEEKNNGETVADNEEDRPPSKLGERMIELGLISKDQLHVALRDQKERKQMLGEVLVHHGFVTEATLTEVLSDSSGYERFDLEKAVIDTSLLNTVPKDIATNYKVFPVSLKEDTLYLAMADVYDIFAIDQIRRFFPAKIEITPLISSDKEIATCIQKYFGYELSIDGLLTEIEGGENNASSQDLEDDGVAEGDFSHPVVRLVNSLLLDAIKVGASDMHFEPEGNYLRIRYRIDGEMRQIRSLHKSHWSSVANRIKIMGNMDVANRIEAQDGRIQMMLGNASIDFRVSSLPTIHGENFVLRVLDKSTAQVAIQQLGFSDENFQLLERLISKPEGIIIVTGPTGSGKTTTLYAVLNHLNSIDVNIMTLEDPVEYELPLIRQCQVREGSTVDFEHGIKALLRQDPDIILIGEVRNQITAIQTLRAAMTGHQVFTTLHTNSAVGALPRLMDLGIHAGLMAGNIVGILGQRLSRKLCPHCKEMKPITEEEAEILKIPYDPSIMVGHKVGCPECEHIGLKGRVAIAEIMPMAKELEDMLARGETTEVIRRASVKYGFKPMANDALDKILDGIITIESAMKVVDMDERLDTEEL